MEKKMVRSHKLINHKHDFFPKVFNTFSPEKMDFFFGDFFSIEISSKFSNFFYITKVRKKTLFIVQ
jgi:hypothetical protein